MVPVLKNVASLRDLTLKAYGSWPGAHQFSALKGKILLKNSHELIIVLSYSKRNIFIQNLNPYNLVCTEYQTSVVPDYMCAGR